MSPDSVTASRPADSRYVALEERIMARDQKGASEVYYGLVRDGRPLPEMLREAVRIHAPYTHVPYHERMDDGYVNFVNNDHCLLSARAALNLSKMLPGAASGLPLAQTIWYIPTGLDIWNQKIAKAPGHYSRGFQMPDGPPPAPVVHWPDQAPLALDGPLKQRLGQWMTLVHRGQVIDAYRVFLGLMQNPAERRAALAELCFAGLIDVQDRSFQNRSYTTGHKSFRARATVELGEAIGWDDAHDVLYAGALDIAVGPRWYSLYEVACNAITVYLEGHTLHAVPYSGTTEQERAIGRHRNPRRAELLPATALLRIRQHAGLVLGHVRASAAAETALSRRRLSQPECLAPEAHQRPHAAAHRDSDHPRARRRGGREPRRGVLRGARLAQGAGLDPGRARLRSPHRAAGAGHRDGLLAARQRPAQPGDRPLYAGGFRQEPESAEGPPAAGCRASHGTASQVRRCAGLQPSLRQGAGCRSAELGLRRHGADHRSSLSTNSNRSAFR